MTAIKFLLAGAAFAVSAAFALAADVPPSVEQGLYSNGRWSVSGIAFADGHKDCVVGNQQPTSSGESAFVLNQFGDGGSTIMFHDTTTTWNPSGESLTFQVDGNPSFTAQAQTDTTRNVVVVMLDGTPRTVMGAFINQLESGRLLLVTPNVGSPRTFALDGAQPALDAFGHCIAAMSSDDDRRP